MYSPINHHQHGFFASSSPSSSGMGRSSSIDAAGAATSGIPAARRPDRRKICTEEA